MLWPWVSRFTTGVLFFHLWDGSDNAQAVGTSTQITSRKPFELFGNSTQDMIRRRRAVEKCARWQLEWSECALHRRGHGVKNGAFPFPHLVPFIYLPADSPPPAGPPHSTVSTTRLSLEESLIIPTCALLLTTPCHPQQSLKCPLLNPTAALSAQLLLTVIMPRRAENYDYSGLHVIW